MPEEEIQKIRHKIPEVTILAAPTGGDGGPERDGDGRVLRPPRGRHTRHPRRSPRRRRREQLPRRDLRQRHAGRRRRLLSQGCRAQR